MTTTETGINFEAVLDRMIEITEKNLTMQGEFLKAVYELRGRFDTADRDHKEMSDDIKEALTISTDMLNKMNVASNEKIIDMLEKAKDLENQSTQVLTDVKGSLKSVQTSLGKSEDYQKCVDEMSNDVKEIATSYKWVKRILGLIALLAIGVQIILGILQSSKNEGVSDEVRKEIIQIMKRHTNSRIKLPMKID